MNTAASNADALIKEARRSHPSTRWLVYERVARDFGEGFAAVVKQQVEDAERRRGQRTPRAQRKGGERANH
jgi:hypothetical protein